MTYVERSDEEITEAFKQIIDERRYDCDDDSRDEYDVLLEEMEGGSAVGKEFIKLVDHLKLF